MRDRDDVPYIVIERESGGGVGSFLLGALLGAGVALLFAPKTGKETQEELKVRAQQLRDAAEERVRDASRQLEDRLEEIRSLYECAHQPLLALIFQVYLPFC